VHGSVGLDEVEGAHPLLLVQPRQQLRGTRILERDRAQPACAVELEDARDHELAQSAVGVVQKPGLVSRGAA
jgi:hypothetical protein